MVEKELGAQAVGHSTSSLKRTMLLPTETYAFLALNIATIIWGSQHAVLKNIVKTSSPAAVNAVRFSIAAALAAPWLPWNAHCHGARATWLAGAELGGWMFCGFSLQVYGLQFTSASRSAFLLYLNVKLVPIFALLLYGRQASLTSVTCVRPVSEGSAIVRRAGR